MFLIKVTEDFPASVMALPKGALYVLIDSACDLRKDMYEASRQLDAYVMHIRILIDPAADSRHPWGPGF